MLRAIELPVVPREEHRGTRVILGDVVAVGVGEPLDHLRITASTQRATSKEVPSK